MKKLKIYLDTSVWNFAFAEDAPEKQEVTLDFFQYANNYEFYTSLIVLEEIKQAQDNKKEQLESLIKKHNPELLSTNNEINRLANLYVEKRIIPLKKKDDALHIALSTFYGMDILLSWNYKHLANVFKKRKILIVNLEEGYDKPLELITPLEVISDEFDELP